MNIKKGDLVMVVKPLRCCGNTSFIGHIFTVLNVGFERARCVHCGHIAGFESADFDDLGTVDIARLKKIDPPANGDSLPTRADLEVTA